MAIFIVFLSLASFVLSNDGHEKKQVKSLFHTYLHYYAEKVKNGSLETKHSLCAQLESAIPGIYDRMKDAYPFSFINMQKAEWLSVYQCGKTVCYCKSNRKALANSYYVKDCFPYLFLYQMHAVGPICQIWDAQAKVVVKAISLEKEDVRIQLGYKSLFWPKSNTSLYKYDIESKQESMVHLPSHQKFYPSIHDNSIFYLFNVNGAKKTLSKIELGSSISTIHHTFDISFIDEAIEIISLIETANPEYSYLKAGQNLYLYNQKSGFVDQDKFAEDVVQVCCSNDNHLFSFATKKDDQNKIHVYFANDITSPSYVLNVSGFNSYMFSPSNSPVFFFWSSGHQCGYWNGNHMVPEVELQSLPNIYGLKPFALTDGKNDLFVMNEYDFSSNANQNN